MYDFHMHTRVSFDSETEPAQAVAVAEKKGLKEICFTDHYDFHTCPDGQHYLFAVEDYSREYDGLKSDSVIIRKGVEFGLTEWNRKELDKLLSARKFDFVIGSVHFVDGVDPYFPEYWQGRDMRTAFEVYLDQTLKCVKLHDNFDVLGHLTYACKSPLNPTKEPIYYKDFSDVCDEIMKILVSKGKGMEINTSGVDRVGAFLPSAEFLRRFKELGGEIVTIGSDAHDADRVGQYSGEAAEILKDIFGYVCTFADRKPTFHKL